MPIALSTTDRKLACLHEAGHAFVHALTGNKVISLIVADAGRFGVIVQGRRCRVLKGNVGAKILEKEGRIDFKRNEVAAQLLPEPEYGWM